MLGKIYTYNHHTFSLYTLVAQEAKRENIDSHTHNKHLFLMHCPVAQNVHATVDIRFLYNLQIMAIL